MIIVGGMTQDRAQAELGISRQTLWRFRRDKHWPGDGAPFDTIRRFVASKSNATANHDKKPRGKVKDGAPSKHLPMSPVDPLRNVLNSPTESSEFAAAMELNDEIKMVLIEKYKSQIAANQKKVIEEHKGRLIARLSSALDRIYEAVSLMDLTPAQIQELRDAIKRATKELTT
jgi:hypothetical protein